MREVAFQRFVDTKTQISSFDKTPVVDTGVRYFDILASLIDTLVYVNVTQVSNLAILSACFMDEGKTMRNMNHDEGLYNLAVRTKKF